MINKKSGFLKTGIKLQKPLIRFILILKTLLMCCVFAPVLSKNVQKQTVAKISVAQVKAITQIMQCSTVILDNMNHNNKGQ